MLRRYLKGIGIAEMLLALSVLVLVVVVAIPVLLIFWTALFVDGQFNIKDIVKVLSEPDTYEALKNSIVIAAGVTFFSTIIGVFFAWLVSRTDLPFKNTMKLLFLIPFMLPSFIGALAWKMLLSPRSGYVNKFIMNTFGLKARCSTSTAWPGSLPWKPCICFRSFSSRFQERWNEWTPRSKSRRAYQGPA